MRKEKLVRIISEHIVDEQIFEVEILDKLPTESTNLTAEQIELEKYKMQTRLELEKAKMEQEIRLWEISLTEVTQEPDRNAFDLVKQVRLVPKFVEVNVDEYFPHFELLTGNGHKKVGLCFYRPSSQEKHKKHTPHCQQKTVQIYCWLDIFIHVYLCVFVFIILFSLK